MRNALQHVAAAHNKTTRVTCAHINKISYSVCLCFVNTKSNSTELRGWFRQNNDLWIMRYCGHAHMCPWWIYEEHVPVFALFMNRKYGTPTTVGATSAFCAIRNRSTRINTFDHRCYCHCSCLITVYETAAIIQNKWVTSNNRFNFVKWNTWAIILYDITSYMGCCFDYCSGGMSSCRPSLCWWSCCASWRRQGSRGDEVMFATSNLVGYQRHV